MKDTYKILIAVTLIVGTICLITYYGLKRTAESLVEDLQGGLHTLITPDLKKQQDELQTLEQKVTTLSRQQDELRAVQKKLSEREDERAQKIAQEQAAQERKTPEQILDPWETEQARHIRQDQEYQRPTNPEAYRVRERVI